jgi:hypothetical protein
VVFLAGIVVLRGEERGISGRYSGALDGDGGGRVRLSTSRCID